MNIPMQLTNPQSGLPSILTPHESPADYEIVRPNTEK